MDQIETDNRSSLEKFLDELSTKFSDAPITLSPNPRDMLSDAEREQHEQQMLAIHEYHRRPDM